MEKHLNTSLSADCSSRVYDFGCGLQGLAHAAKSSHKSGSVVAVANARHACPGCAPLTDGAAAGTWRGETDAWGLHGGDLAVGLPRMLLQSVPMG